MTGEAELLIRLADPEASLPVDMPTDRSCLARILAAADQHGVMPIVFRKFSALDTTNQDLWGSAASILEQYVSRLVGVVGHSMQLDRQAGSIAEQFAKAGVKAAIVKGPVFADLLYRNRSDRPFTDIDFLIPLEALEAANDLMGTLGFTRQEKAWDNSYRDREYKWCMKENQSILVELHGDLVHYPMLRRQLSFGFDQLVQIEDGVPKSPVALLMTSVVHAACGHKFHQLSLLVDVVQAVRRLTADDTERFVKASGVLGATLEAAVTLNLVGRLFDESRASELASLFGEHWTIRLGRRLIGPEVIVGADAQDQLTSRLRRHGFRQLQQLGPIRP